MLVSFVQAIIHHTNIGAMQKMECRAPGMAVGGSVNSQDNRASTAGVTVLAGALLEL
jgi:hypothetical protein